jgi:hypothetical protein
MESARKVPEEIRQILAEVCAEYRVRIDADDPAVAVVMLNRLVLELVLSRAVERIEAATTALNGQVDAVQVRIGAVLAQELRSARNQSRDSPREAQPHIAPFSVTKLTLVAAALTIFAVGLFAGILIR